MRRLLERFTVELCLILSIVLLLALCFCGWKRELLPPELPSAGEETSESSGAADSEEMSSNGSGSGEAASDPDPAFDPAAYPLVISEVMARSTLYTRPDGKVSDWVELYNAGEIEASLAGVQFCGRPLEGSIAPGAYAVFYCSIPKSGTLELTLPDGSLLQQLELPELAKDHAYVRQVKGALAGTVEGVTALGGGYFDSRFPTPGEENSAAGYERCLEKEQRGALQIEEVVVSGAGKGGDWVELCNRSQEPIDLGDFTVCDRGGTPQEIPGGGSLAPGERVLLYCGEGETPPGARVLPFKLSSKGDHFYIWQKDGSLSDGCLLESLPVGGSYGRMAGKSGFFFFAKASQSKPDPDGKRYVTAVPPLSPPPGCYDGSLTVTVPTASALELHYTLDGSLPTEQSHTFQEGLRVQSSCSLQMLAVSKTLDALPSRVLTAPYLTDGTHRLPVVCLTLDPRDMWSRERGIYHELNSFEKWERPTNLTIFSEESGNLSVNCGISLSGAGSRELPKKSMQLKFRSRYGAKQLQYDLFGDGEECFDCVKLRAGEDYGISVFRDELVASLAAETDGGLRVQRYRYCVVYVNGEYFGLFAFRDKLDEHFVAAAEDCTTEQIEGLLEYAEGVEYGSNANYVSLVKFILSTDMQKPENYARVEEEIEIDSLIDWLIAEIYTCNQDFPNERKYRVEGGKWTWILYDMDWSFYYHTGSYQILSSGKGLQTGRMAKALLKNPQFRERFLTRLGQQLNSCYSYASVSARCAEFMVLLEEEMPRNCKRWGGSVSGWKKQVDRIISFARDRRALLVRQTVYQLGVTKEEIERFGLGEERGA